LLSPPPRLHRLQLLALPYPLCPLPTHAHTRMPLVPQCHGINITCPISFCSPDATPTPPLTLPKSGVTPEPLTLPQLWHRRCPPLCLRRTRLRMHLCQSVLAECSTLTPSRRRELMFAVEMCAHLLLREESGPLFGFVPAAYLETGMLPHHARYLCPVALCTTPYICSLFHLLRPSPSFVSLPPPPSPHLPFCCSLRQTQSTSSL